MPFSLFYLFGRAPLRQLADRVRLSLQSFKPALTLCLKGFTFYPSRSFYLHLLFIADVGVIITAILNQLLLLYIP